VSEIDRLRGEGRWPDAVALTDDPLVRADLLAEQALFAGDAEARRRAGEELDRAEALLELGRGRVLHARWLAERGEEDPAELAHFERALELAAGGELEGQARFWIGIVHQVVRGDGAAALPWLEEAYASAREAGDGLLISYAARHLGFALLDRGDEAAALALLQESAELRRREGFLTGLAAALLSLGEVAAEGGRPDEARRHLEEARELAERVGAAPFLARIEGALAGLP
jgi:tetratricopeptide (TPR) repeat protein